MAFSISHHFKFDFCLHLANLALEEEATKGSNIVVSPLSLHVMLSLVATGSKVHTLEQLLFFLRSKDVGELTSSSSRIMSLASFPQEGGGNLSSGSTLVVRQWRLGGSVFNLKPSFEAIVKGSYKAEFGSVDFVNKPNEASNEVNSWAEKETKGLIKCILPCEAINHRTVLVVANALYFKGSWDKTFDASRT